jgi:Flp pilus assembly protein TadD
MILATAGAVENTKSAAELKVAKKIKIVTKKQKSLKDFEAAFHHYQSGNFRQAEMICRQILQKQPNYSEVLHLLGIITAQIGEHDNAVRYIEKAIQINPHMYFYYNSLGLVLSDKGLFDEAIENYNKTLKLMPDNVAAYNNLGLALAEKGLLNEAVENYKKALILKPDDAEVYNNLGLALAEKGLLDEAVENYKKALMLAPDYAAAYNNLGNSLADRGLPDEAIENFKMALTLKSDYAEAYSNLAGTLKNKGRVDEAIENYNRALKLKPHNADMHNNLGMAYLLAKNFDKGWEEYEWRLGTMHVAPLIKPKWDGGSLEDKVILVHAEQGYGDTLQFVRYLPLLYESGAGKVLFKLNKQGLEQLLRGSELKAEIIDLSIPDEILDIDTNIHLVSLPGIFKTNLENIPFRQKRYLKANPERVEWYRERYFTDTLRQAQGDNDVVVSMSNHDRAADLSLVTRHSSLIKIGIFWQGNPTLKPDRNRSMPLHHFYPICRLPNVKVYSLQKGYGIEQLNDPPEDIQIVNLGETFNNFSDTAAAIENFDIVITIDTAVAHLSGALGKKTWILLPSHAEWRWHLDMDYSPWYEDVRLFRHKEPGKKDWDEMMERVVRQVEAEIKNR